MLDRVILGLCAVALFCLMIVGAADIFLGQLFGLYLGFKVDLSQILLAMSVFLAWIIVQKRDENIRVDILVNRAPGWIWMISSFLTAICGAIVFGLITYGTYRMASTSYMGNETSAATLGFPIWPAKVICAGAAFITLIVFLLHPFAKHNKKIKSGGSTE